MELGKLGVWVSMDSMSAAAGAAFAKRVEDWGYTALWIPESRGRDALAHSAWLLANTQRLIVATGIANKGDFAMRWNVSPRCVDVWLKAGLPHLKLSARMIRINVPDADQWLKEKFGTQRRAA